MGENVKGCVCVRLSRRGQRGTTDELSHFQANTIQAIPVLVDGRRGGEPVLVQGLHERKFAERGEAGHVEPRGRLAVLQVVPFLRGCVGWGGGIG